MGNIIELQNIAVKVSCSDWEDAIYKAGNLLVKSEYIKEQYTHEMIEAVKKMGPYIVMVPHIALAHARPSDSVLKEGISLITLKKPVEFGSKHNDPVRVVIAFGAKDSQKHLGSLQLLANVLEDEEKMQEIMNADDKLTIYNVLKNN